METNDIRTAVVKKLLDLPVLDTILIAAQHLDIDVNELDGEVILNDEPISDADWTNYFSDALDDADDKTIRLINDSGELV